MTEKKTTKKAEPVVDLVNEAMEIVGQIVAPQYCDQCKTLVHLCICQWRGNEGYDCDCTNCPCMEQVKIEGAVCAKCKAHE